MSEGGQSGGAVSTYFGGEGERVRDEDEGPGRLCNGKRHDMSIREGLGVDIQAAGTSTVDCPHTGELNLWFFRSRRN